MEGDYAKVKREQLEVCLTCLLCFNLLREATTITVCLHRFCKECIYQRFKDDESNRCPFCNVYLGTSPQDKLRRDNSLEEIKNKFFPSEKANETPSKQNLPTPTTIKEEISLSELAPTTISPEMEMRPNIRKAKAEALKLIASQTMKTRVRNDKNVKEEKIKWSDKISKVSNKKISGEAGASNGNAANDSKKDNDSGWEKFNILAETAHRTSNSSSPLSSLLQIAKNYGKKSYTRKLSGQAIGSLSISNKNKGKLINENRDTTEEESEKDSSNDSNYYNESEEQAVSNMKILNPIWFTLQAFKDQTNPYPQIPKSYIRIKDGNVPVSCIRKYIAQKLKLEDETEVEIMCCDQALNPDAALNSAVDVWLKFATDLNNFVMVLTYRRSLLSSESSTN